MTLDAPAQSAVSVRYRTADGSARAGADYVAAPGAVRFAPGETEKTVEVAVVKDSHDEGSESMTLTLYRASGASIGDDVATGTIVNTGPMPQAWIAQFGRTAKAAENGGRLVGRDDRRLASMRPRHKAAENSLSGPPMRPLPTRFNEAAA